VKARTLITCLVSALALWAGAVERVIAQERATIQALATVVSSLTVIGSNNLLFGTVTPGINKSVDKATIGFAGEWTITGSGGAELNIAIDLPDSLHTSDTLSAMYITFSNTDASYDDGSGGGQTAPSGVLNPAGPSVLRLSAGGEMRIWIGGTVHPRVSQTGGDYAADIMLTVAYTGS